MSQPQGIDEQTRDFVTAFSKFMEHVHVLADSGGEGERLFDRLTAHLGHDVGSLPVVAEQIPVHRVVDADIALDEIAEGEKTPGVDARPTVIGIGGGGGDMRHHMTLGDLLQNGMHGMNFRVGQVDYANASTGPGPDDKRQIVASGIRLFWFDGSPVAVRQQSPSRQYGREEGALEVLANDRQTADALIGRVRELMDERSILKGQVITFGTDPYGRGMAGLSFLERPTLSRDDIVLPDHQLDKVVAHVVGIGEQRARLQAHGQHLKRGVLLYGPPGTGKTHTVRYLLSASPGTTAVLLSGGALEYIHAAAKIVRAHQPAIVVLEDCDLVAEDRSIGMGSSPLLFEVLDALDGLDSDADVAFLLTTNRVDDLEVALSQRPGRVDLAVEIPLPDEAGRLALLRLYGRDLFGEKAMADAAARSAGTTASFAKELVRRAVLMAAIEGAEGTDLTDGHLTAALDDLLSDAEHLTRSLLGVGAGDGGPSDLPPGAGPGLMRPPRPRRGGGSTGGWVASSPRG
ncbi:AAA family ATPase [Humibacillus sp. DSM 29435]|uniref:AAA family ATPase n=1 Tax=Humibacillus sp. DSM 29435 TaxID=1869167 RepID=UPI0009F4B9A4|nr:AAA family ATPase [Humibacillus sp. DSM 29435]